MATRYRVYRVEQSSPCTITREFVAELCDFEKACVVAETLVAPFVSGVVLKVEHRTGIDKALAMRWPKQRPRIVHSR